MSSLKTFFGISLAGGCVGGTPSYHGLVLDTGSPYGGPLPARSHSVDFVNMNELYENHNLILTNKAFYIVPAQDNAAICNNYQALPSILSLSCSLQTFDSRSRAMMAVETDLSRTSTTNTKISAILGIVLAVTTTLVVVSLMNAAHADPFSWGPYTHSQLHKFCLKYHNWYPWKCQHSDR
jgi:hypothetical protein